MRMLRIAIALGAILGVVMAVVTIVAMSACDQAPPPDPTPEAPQTGCIMPTLAQRGGREGKMLPETVRVFGRTSIDDGQRLKVARGPNFDFSKWEPHNDARIVPDDPQAIHFGAICGRETRALDDMFSASRGDGATARQTFPPR